MKLIFILINVICFLTVIYYYFKYDISIYHIFIQLILLLIQILI